MSSVGGQRVRGSPTVGPGMDRLVSMMKVVAAGDACAARGGEAGFRQDTGRGDAGGVRANVCALKAQRSSSQV